MQQQHDEAVSELSSRVKDFYTRSIPFRIYHGNTNSTRKSPRTTSNSLDVSCLNRIISIDPSTRMCVCEPNVPMDKLLSATSANKYSLMPPVVPEFPGITVGGAFAGTGGESSSFKYGFFDRSVVAIEMILADGTVTTAHADVNGPNTDLFHGAASTFGTLGVLTLLHIRLIPCKPYVELTYHPVASISEAVSTISSFMPHSNNSTTATTASSLDEPVDFLDGVMFTPRQGVIMTGRFSDGPSTTTTTTTTTTFHKASDEWFYLHAQRYSSLAFTTATAATAATAATHTDIIPLESYIFRFDRGAFWMGMYGFKYFLVPFTRTTRRILDRFMHTRALYYGLHSSGLSEHFIIQDMAVPSSKMEEFSNWLDSNDSDIVGGGGGGCGEIYPRWLCPLMDHQGFQRSFPEQSPQSGQSAQPAQEDGAAIDVSRFTMNPCLPKQVRTNDSTDENSNDNNNNNNNNNNFLLNIGVWGPFPDSPLLKPGFTRSSESRSKSRSGSMKTKPTTIKSINRAIERKLALLQGRKWLYAQTFYTEDEFWQIYDRDVYEALRKKYKAHGRLPSVYDKVGPKTKAKTGERRNDTSKKKKKEEEEEEEESNSSAGRRKVQDQDDADNSDINGSDNGSGDWRSTVSNIWPIRGLYGFMSILKGGDYLRKRTV